MMTDNGKLIIQGVTAEGKIFRPSDWAERVSGRLATFKNQRMMYSPLLHPGIQDGIRCVIVAKSLKHSNPDLYEHMLEFARVNHLKICMDPLVA